MRLRLRLHLRLCLCPALRPICALFARVPCDRYTSGRMNMPTLGKRAPFNATPFRPQSTVKRVLAAVELAPYGSRRSRAAAPAARV